MSDFNLPGFSGLQALDIVRARDRIVPFILVSGEIGEDTAVAAMRSGASLLKGGCVTSKPRRRSPCVPRRSCTERCACDCGAAVLTATRPPTKPALPALWLPPYSVPAGPLTTSTRATPASESGVVN